MAPLFGWTSRRTQWQGFAAATVLSLILMVALNASATALRTEEAPLGIVSYEFAFTATKADAILDSWDPSGKIAAAFNLGLDYLFLFAYSASIALGCALVATANGVGGAWFSKVGITLAWLQFLAAGFDAVENYALLRMLFSGGDDRLAAIAAYCAIVKFVLVLCGMLYFFGGLALIPVFRQREPA